jgi:hypothetical protein
MRLRKSTKEADAMKFVSWNVNGLRACVQKGFSDYFLEADADFFCLQETKLQAGQIDLSFPGYTSYWNYAEKKGYSGTALFTKKQPLQVGFGIGIAANLGAIGETKGLAALLADMNTVSGAGRTVALTELVGIGVSLNGQAEGLGRAQRGVLNVIGPQVSGFRAVGALGNTGQTVPGNTVSINISGGVQNVQYTLVNTGFKQALASSIPSNGGRHINIPPQINNPALPIKPEGIVI